MKTEARKAYEKKWKADNKERVRAVEKARVERENLDPKKKVEKLRRARRWKKKNPAKVKVYKSNGMSKRRELAWEKLDLEIDFNDFLDMLATQRFRCKICGDRVTLSAPVDHDHQTGKERGILCRTCNLGLGAFFDNPTFLRNAAAYVLEYAGYRPFAELTN